MKLELITPPQILPISLDSVKSYLKVLDSKQDEQIELLIKAMITQAENITNRQLGGAATFALYLDSWDTISIPKAPFVEIEKIEYKDKNSETLELDILLYDIDTKSTPAVLFFYEKPSISDKPNSIAIQYRAGYETLPKEVELWIKVKVLEEFYALPTIERNKYIDRMLDSLRVIPI